MRVKCIEHTDDFSQSEHIFWLEVEDVLNEFIEQAKEIDGENFLISCFGICVICTEDEWVICEELLGHQLFYIDNNGEKNWMPYKLTLEEECDAINYCKRR